MIGRTSERTASRATPKSWSMASQHPATLGRHRRKLGDRAPPPPNIVSAPGQCWLQSRQRLGRVRPKGSGFDRLWLDVGRSPPLRRNFTANSWVNHQRGTRCRCGVVSVSLHSLWRMYSYSNSIRAMPARHPQRRWWGWPVWSGRFVTISQSQTSSGMTTASLDNSDFSLQRPMANFEV